MSEPESTLKALREAVRLAPDNIALGEHFIHELLGQLRYDEAEQHARLLLSRHAKSTRLKVLVAKVYYTQNKNSHALAITETLIQSDRPAPAALVLHARLLYRGGNVADAVARYRQAVEIDDAVQDQEFENLLGIGNWTEPQDDDDITEAMEGRLRNFIDGDFDSQLEMEADIERPETCFDDVGGMEEIKEKIRFRIIYPTQQESLFSTFSRKPGGGILLFGPPGCGKTHVARSTAGEIDSKLISISVADIFDMWVGNSERNLHAVFNQARHAQPCVLFFDEFDALGANRSEMRHNASRHLVNQFLSEMDGADSDNEGVLIIAATNAPWSIDPAFRRPGRFDERLFVPPPDQETRQQIFDILLCNKPRSSINYKQLGSKTAGYSGADIRAVVELAIDRKLQLAMEQGNPRPLTNKDLLDAIKSIQPTTSEWFETVKTYAEISNPNGFYNDVLAYMKTNP